MVVLPALRFNQPEELRGGARGIGDGELGAENGAWVRGIDRHRASKAIDRAGVRGFEVGFLSPIRRLS